MREGVTDTAGGSIPVDCHSNEIASQTQCLVFLHVRAKAATISNS